MFNSSAKKFIHMLHSFYPNCLFDRFELESWIMLKQIALYLTRLQSDEVSPGSLESRESAQIRTYHVNLAEDAGLLIR